MSAVECLRRLEEARAFLSKRLAVSPRPARAVLKATKAVGIAKRTLHRAKAAPSVQVRREGWGKSGRLVRFPLTMSSASQTSLAQVSTRQAYQQGRARNPLAQVSGRKHRLALLNICSSRGNIKGMKITTSRQTETRDHS
jgi:hypothetical protein